MATELASYFPSPPLMKSSIRVWGSLIISLRRYHVPWISLFFFLFHISTATSISSSSDMINYSDHCNSIVPETNSNGEELSPLRFLQLQNGYFTGGDNIIEENPQSSLDYSNALSFFPSNIFKTDNEDVLKVEGSLNIQVYSQMWNITYERPLHRRRFRTRGTQFPFQRGQLDFWFEGFWSKASGKLCMVGSGSGYSKEGKPLEFAAVFKLNYPNNSTILTSLVDGKLESLDATDHLNYFDPISILAFSQRNYNYTLISKETGNNFPGVDEDQKNPSLGLEAGRGICSMLFNYGNTFELEYGSDCDVAKNCNPFEFLPSFMSFNGVQCSDNHRLRLLLIFSNTSYTWYNQALAPNRSLVGEGIWDGKKKRLFLVACRIHIDSSTNASVRDCSIRLSLRFPSILTIRNRSVIVGEIGTNKTMNDLGYFDKIVFRSTQSRHRTVSGVSGVSGVKYEYTEADRVRKLCEKKKAVKNKSSRYPDGYSSDMKFDMSVKKNSQERGWGYSTPLSVGDQLYEHFFDSFSSSDVSKVSTDESISLNVSYTVSFTIYPDSKAGAGNIMGHSSRSQTSHLEIYAEGIYDGESGSLCMVGCRNVASNGSTDCEIVIKFQFPSVNGKIGESVKGTIESKRKNDDPLHFESLELSSMAMYSSQTGEFIWRMDFEITMVLISNTLACIFVALQLFYVKKHPNKLSFISLTMLFILTLGHMIPLVLNFEALFFANHKQRDVFLQSGGWLEVNEVIVRIVTMVAFLLQFRLFQQTWSTKLSDRNPKDLWISEKKSVYVSFLVYLVGGLIALFVHWRKNSYGYLLGDLKSYAGLVLDGFLLPQILINLFSNSKEKALFPAYYVGITAVRLLPHGYDLYRTHKYMHRFGLSYIYANPDADFYSTAWDVIIPFGGVFLAFLVFLQQRFGGRCFLPSRFRGPGGYEKVPVDAGERLQEESITII